MMRDASKGATSLRKFPPDKIGRGESDLVLRPVIEMPREGRPDCASSRPPKLAVAIEQRYFAFGASSAGSTPAVPRERHVV